MKAKLFTLAVLYFLNLSISPGASMVILDVGGGPSALSADGRYLTGTGSSGAFRWNNGTILYVTDTSSAQVMDLSGDGQILIGTQFPKAFRWQDGVRSDLPLPFVNNPRTQATAISADGTVIVGSLSPALGGTGGPEAAMWKDGMISGG